MPIPNNIYREHIFQAIIDVFRNGIPANRRSRIWLLNYEGRTYPVKYVVSKANYYANGYELDPDPNNFTSDMAADYLQRRGFIIEEFRIN